MRGQKGNTYKNGLALLGLGLGLYGLQAGSIFGMGFTRLQAPPIVAFPARDPGLDVFGTIFRRNRSEAGWNHGLGREKGRRRLKKVKFCLWVGPEGRQ